jgi:hypothetical protein
VASDTVQNRVNENSTMSPAWAAFWTAVIYAFGVLILGGGAGIWIPAVMPAKSVEIDALTTFVMATLAPIFVDLILDVGVNKRSPSQLWRVSLIVACFLAGALAITALLREHSSGDWFSGVAAVIISIVIWIVLTLKTERFLQEGSKKGSIGGAKPAPEVLPGKGIPE